MIRPERIIPALFLISYLHLYCFPSPSPVRLQFSSHTSTHKPFLPLPPRPIHMHRSLQLATLLAASPTSLSFCHQMTHLTYIAPCSWPPRATPAWTPSRRSSRPGRRATTRRRAPTGQPSGGCMPSSCIPRTPALLREWRSARSRPPAWRGRRPPRRLRSSVAASSR